VAELNNTPLPTTPLLALTTNTLVVDFRLSAHGGLRRLTTFGHQVLSRTPTVLIALIRLLRFVLDIPILRLGLRPTIAYRSLGG